MNDLLLHDRTAEDARSAVTAKPHALMIIGSEGSGKESLANTVIAGMLDIDSIKLNSYPFFTKVEPEKNNITIDQIRELQKFLQLRTTGTAIIRRAVIIKDAHLMNIEAQNAILKILEEPPADTVIILTAVGEKSLKSTIYSRTQRLYVKIPDKKSAMDYFSDQGFENTIIARNYLLSGGNVGLLSSLLHDSDSHKLVSALSTAKQLLSSDIYHRLAKADEISKQKESIPDILFSLKRIATAALHNAAETDNSKLIKRWHKTLDAVLETEASLKYSPNSKLLLTNLFLQM